MNRWSLIFGLLGVLLELVGVAIAAVGIQDRVRAFGHTFVGWPTVSSRTATYVVLLTPDYDPWAGYEWPDRAGQLKRAPRRKPVDP